MSLNPDLTSCNFQDFLRSAETIVKPAYHGINGGSLGPHHGTYLKYFTNNFYKWLDNMWIDYKTNNCESFKNRYAHWNSEVTGPNAITDSYHMAIKKSKMLWAQTMHSNCGCVGNRPSVNNIDNTTSVEPQTPVQRLSKQPNRINTITGSRSGY